MFHTKYVLTIVVILTLIILLLVFKDDLVDFLEPAARWMHESVPMLFNDRFIHFQCAQQYTGRLVDTDSWSYHSFISSGMCAGSSL
jgi:hypothetical protein